MIPQSKSRDSQSNPTPPPPPPPPPESNTHETHPKIMKLTSMELTIYFLTFNVHRCYVTVTFYFLICDVHRRYTNITLLHTVTQAAVPRTRAYSML